LVLTCPAPIWRRLATLYCAAAALACAIGERAGAQRVEFPSAVPGASPLYPTTPQPSLTSPPAFDPYATPGLGSPPADIPYTPAPTLTPNFGAPPLSAPPTMGLPYQAPPSVPPGGNLFQHTPTVQWNRGTYDYQNPDGTVARLQRFMQQISIEHTHLFGNGNDHQLQIDRTEMDVTFGAPLFYNPESPVLITPGFAFNWFEGPPTSAGADLPPQVYDAYLDAAWYPRFNDFLAADLGVRPGVWSDFHAVNSHSFRVMGRGLGIITLSPRMDLHVGVWYLNRNRIKLLPAGGIHWRPNTEWDAFLIFPNPKVRKRFVNIGSSQWWWYVAGEYGGGRWTIERDPAGPAGAIDDDIDYNDIRVIGGLEFETATQMHGHVEVGYVFDRELLYDSGAPSSFNLDDTVMLRAGVEF
jgi:hypothetical protein